MLSEQCLIDHLGVMQVNAVNELAGHVSDVVYDV